MRNTDSFGAGGLGCEFVAGIHVSRDTNTGVVGQDSFEAACCGICAIGYCYLTGMERVTYTDPASVMN